MTPGRIRTTVGLILVALLPLTAGAQLRFSIVPGHGGLPLNMVEAGERGKPAILFVHGFAQSYLAFDRQLKSDLAERFHLVAFDMRGHGVSPKPWEPQAYADSRIWADDVHAIIVAAELDRPVLVGWSYGGHVVIDYVRYYGLDNVSGINLVGSLAGIIKMPPPPQAETTNAIAANSERSRSLNGWENILAARATGEFLSTPNMTDTERQIAFAMQAMMPAYVRRAMMGRDLDKQDALEKLTGPVLLTRGTRDIVMPEAGTSELLAHLPRGEISIYADTGHLPFVQHTERFNGELATFVERVRAD